MIAAIARRPALPCWAWALPLLLVARPVQACTVIPYFRMIFEGHEEYTLQLTWGFAVAIVLVVFFKAALLDRHLRSTTYFGDVPARKTFPQTLLAVVVANVVSLVTGLATAANFTTTGGFHILFTPVFAFLVGAAWILILRYQAKLDLDVTPIRLRWLVLMLLVGFLLYPLTAVAVIVAFCVLWAAPLLLLAHWAAAKLGLIDLEKRAKAAARAEPDALDATLTCLTGVGFACGFVGGGLANEASRLGALVSASQAAAYWGLKIAITTAIFGIALVSTTAVEAIVLLPYYRFVCETRPGVRVKGADAIARYHQFFGSLFRINGAAVAAVLFLFALRTLPTRLATPGFLY